MSRSERQPHRPPARAGERGFALLLVIWLLALLTLLAAGVAANSSSGTVIVHNRADGAAARARAEAGIVLAIASLLNPDPAQRVPADGRSETFQVGRGSVTVTVEDEGGKIDLNAAPLDLIGGLADELGVDPAVRAALLSGIAARRKDFGAQGAQPLAPFYLAGADPGGLASQPFADASELLRLPGVTRTEIERLLPYVTVYSQRATLNPMTAARETLLAVPGISPQDVDFFLASRTTQSSSIEKPPLSGVDRYVAVTSVRTVTITARGLAGAGAASRREAVVLLSGNFARWPYRILRWQQPRESAPTS